MNDEKQYEEAVLAGGCYWGMEEITRDIDGVLDTEVGFTGGDFENPTYADVKKGDTGHAEAIWVMFDPEILSFRELLEWFFKMHDPTTRNRQGNDLGSQYRSAVFYQSDEQREVAEKMVQEVKDSGRWENEVVTQIVKGGEFTAAMESHQDYLQKNPDGYTCHYIRD
ncbi:peptide-methionine (S)-S-oxide reductase MsrA [Planctomycetota bacterium]|nr:peptide-methionine (S)-S-oxide reductase MsrA [Planctomycetota bacterium]